MQLILMPAQDILSIIASPIHDSLCGLSGNFLLISTIFFISSKLNRFIAFSDRNGFPFYILN